MNTEGKLKIIENWTFKFNTARIQNRADGDELFYGAIIHSEHSTKTTYTGDYCDYDQLIDRVLNEVQDYIWYCCYVNEN